MNFILTKIKHLFKFDKSLVVILFISIPLCVIDGVVEYNRGGLCFYFYRAVATCGFISILCLMIAFGWIKKELLLILSVYFIVVTIFVTLFWGYHDPVFKFEPYFLKVEVMISAMFFVVGLFLRIKHIIYLLFFNCCFILCSIYLYPNFPMAEFAFYAVIIICSGYMAYVSRNTVLDFYREKESNKRITIVNDELKEMNQSKDDLFRIIGHDLRTPFYQLNSLIDMAAEAETEEEKLKFNELIKESAVKGHQLLEDLLSWGTIYRKQSQVLLESKEIGAIVEKVFEFSDIKTKKKEIKLINKLPSDLKISINSAMMETVIRNLIANAIKFSHRGSNIIVKSQEIGEHVIIAIEDRGIGMTNDNVNNLFTKEKNISTQGTENEEGTGFGLSIAKKLVEKQNGIFEIASTSNQGTTISMYFPLDMSA